MDNRRLICVHEAGHLCSALALGEIVVDAFAEHDRGITKYFKAKDPKNALLISVGGAVAEELWGQGNAVQLFKNSATLKKDREIFDQNNIVGASIEEAVNRCRRLLANHRPTIGRLGEALLNFKTVSGDFAAAIFKKG